MLATKEAKTARLQGEVSRLRSISSQQQQQEREEEEDEDGVVAGESPLEPAARKAVLDASQAAKDKPTAILHHLRRCRHQSGSCCERCCTCSRSARAPHEAY
jgi:hypothetical protein